jgi:hypothetical protein
MVKMKKLILSFVIVVSVTSCQKKIENSVDVSTQNSVKTALSPSVRWQNSTGAIIDKSIFENDSDGYIFVEPVSTESANLVVTYFENEQAALDFANLYPKKYANVSYTIDFTRGARELAITTGDDVRVENDETVYSDEFNTYLSSFNPPKMLEKGTGVLYDNYNASGTTRILSPVPIPNFFAFRNRAESVQMVGLSILYSGKVWKGKSAVLFSSNPGNLLYLGGIGMANDAESSI